MTLIQPDTNPGRRPEKQDSQFEWWTAFFGFAVLTCVLWCVWTVALNKCTNRQVSARTRCFNSTISLHSLCNIACQVRHTRVINPV